MTAKKCTKKRDARAKLLFCRRRRRILRSLLSLRRLRRTSRREPWERVCFYPYSQAVPLGVLMVYHGQSSLYSLDHSFFQLLLFLLRHLQVKESLSWTESPRARKCEVIQNPGNFLMESGILALGIRNLAKWIRNPANDWDPRDPESTFHQQEKWSPVPVIRNAQCGIQNPRLFGTALHGTNWDRLIRFLCQIFKCFASQVYYQRWNAARLQPCLLID